MLKAFLLFSILSFASLGFAAEAREVPAQTARALIEELKKQPDLFNRVGVQAKGSPRLGAVLRCSLPLETGFEDDQPECEAEVIGDSTLTSEIEDDAVSKSLVDFFDKYEEYFGGNAQGWAGFRAEVQCSTAGCKARAVESEQED